MFAGLCVWDGTGLVPVAKRTTAPRCSSVSAFITRQNASTAAQPVAL